MMQLFFLCFFLGDLYLQTFSILPSLSWLLFILFLIAVIGLFIRKWKIIGIGFAFLFGLVWTTWYAHSIQSWELSPAQEGRPTLIRGYISSIPAADEWQTSFIFELKQIQEQTEWKSVNTKIRLSQRSIVKPIKVGEEWQFLVHLKRIHSTQNPGAFDYEAWAFQNGLRASGYIVASDQNKLISAHWYQYPINQFREKILEKIKASLPDTPRAPWLIALMIGERDSINPADWNILRNTGTNHLMAIAGLHIGVVSGFAFLVASWCWRRSHSLTLIIPAKQVGACAAFIAALFYSALAGFSIPTQRACTMLSILMIGLLAKRKMNPWSVWSLALFIILLINPLSILTESFWLSFGTIALIIYSMHGRIAPTGWWWKWGRIQWVIGLGLIPITIALFQQFSIISFVANSIAIPWLSFFILPFCLLSGVFVFISPVLGKLFLYLADKSLEGLWCVLTWLAHFQFATFHLSIPNAWVLLITCFCFIVLLLPSGFPGRWIGIIWFLPVLFYPYPKPANGEFWFTLLDVGQGLSVVIQTHSHVLIYDAGPKYQAGFDMGENVVVPYLYHSGIKKIDKLIISHGDNDHIGGAQAVMSAFPTLSLITSTPEKFDRVAQYCHAGSTWQWDNVKFTFLYPSEEDDHLGNDSSCVLRIDNGKQSILLTGDIEKYAEKKLLAFSSTRLAADIIVAPHHGSKTSGLKTFIHAVHPKMVLFATGYRNRYHFPHQSVVDTYDELGVKQFNSVSTGAMKFSTIREGWQVDLYRDSHHHFWLS